MIKNTIFSFKFKGLFRGKSKEDIGVFWSIFQIKSMKSLKKTFLFTNFSKKVQFFLFIFIEKGGFLIRKRMEGLCGK